MPDLARCVERHSLDPVCHVERRARTFLRNDRPTNTLAVLINLTYGIKRTFKHTPRDEKGIQDPAPDSRSRKRELPDFAMLMIEAVLSGWPHASSPDICTFPMTAATAMWAPATRTPGEVSAAIKRIWLSHCADV